MSHDRLPVQEKKPECQKKLELKAVEHMQQDLGSKECDKIDIMAVWGEKAQPIYQSFCVAAITSFNRLAV